MVNRNYEIGDLAEFNARSFLEKNGLIFVEKNYEAFNPDGKQVGEIDLIMKDQKDYVFVEVKYRTKDKYGDVTEMITPQKQTRIIRATKYFLLREGLWDRVQSRFDVIGITPDEKEPIIWIKNAFEVKY